MRDAMALGRERWLQHAAELGQPFALEARVVGVAKQNDQELAAPSFTLDHEILVCQAKPNRVRDKIRECADRALMGFGPVGSLDLGKRGGVDDQQAECAVALEAPADLLECLAQGRRRALVGDLGGFRMRIGGRRHGDRGGTHRGSHRHAPPQD